MFSQSRQKAMIALHSTLPGNVSALANTLERAATTFLCTLYVSAPHLMIKSEKAVSLLMLTDISVCD
jgi:hypothetical protein